MALGKITVFGGTGFLGRRVVQHLLEYEFLIRVASRHPERTAALFSDVHLSIESIRADINDDRSVAAAGVEGVVNAVRLFVEGGHETISRWRPATLAAMALASIPCAVRTMCRAPAT
ncbi:MAG: SDR family oxidoreductase [Methylocella sp.]